ncbi:MAG: SprT family zinc-dependent metalloprotease [Oscillospiraceae bacterium]
MMKIAINLLGEPREIEIERKKMRSVRLRVTDSGEIKVSASKAMPYAMIEKFVRDKRDWIETALAKIAAKTPSQQSEQLIDGGSVRLLGQPFSVRISEGAKIDLSVDFLSSTLNIHTKRPDDEKYLRSQFDRWWRAQCVELYTRKCAELLPIFASFKLGMPAISVKKMTSQWGSCEVNRAKINLNFYLMRAPAECVEYVILHELTHFINPTHNAEFYGFIAKYMPDWKKRRELLKKERIC